MDPPKVNANPYEGAADGSGNGAQAENTERPETPGRRPTAAPTSQPNRPRPSIRLQRFPSAQLVTTLSTIHDEDENAQHQSPSTRRRSSSEPQRPVASGALGAELARAATRTRMASVTEESGSQIARFAQGHQPEASTNAKSRLRSASVSARSMLNRPDESSAQATLADGEYGAGIVNLLDVVDPEVSTLTTLTNVQNSLFVPNLGRFVNRRPTYTFTHQPSYRPGEEDTSGSDETPLAEKEEPQLRAERMDSRITIKSTLSDSRFAVLPEGVTLEGWSATEKSEINDHVRHMLHSRRSKFKRGMKGFWKYVQKPLGFLITLYAVLITLFGLAWVLFLIGWINVGGRQLYVINVIDNVLVALFAIMGDGLAPFRAVDTYHMFFIVRYHRLTWKLRRKKALPKLRDPNDLPRRLEAMSTDEDIDLEEQGENEELSVLKLKQQTRYIHHSGKLAKSHTFYKPHETTTHYAFPLSFLIAVVILLDFHSIFQIALGACTWAIDYRVRSTALTTVLLCCSLTCNITAGIMITIGDRKTRKKDVIERMFRQELTCEAIQKVEKKKRKSQSIKRASTDLMAETESELQQEIVVDKKDRS